MKIPNNKGRKGRMECLAWFVDLKDKCLVSRAERIEQYTSNRLYWLYGSDGSFANEDQDTSLGPPPGNKLWPHIDQLSSFLYAQDTTRFSVQMGASVPDGYQDWIDPLDDYVNDEWHSSNTDIIFGLALNYSLVYGSAFVKPIWRKDGIYPGIILPHNFGVLREDVFMLSKQEAFVHCYTMTVSQFTNDFGELPNFQALLEQVRPRAQSAAEVAGAGIDRIIMSSQDPLGGNGSGQVDWLSQVSMNYIPRLREELIEMFELTVWDDELNDYRLVTIAGGHVPILDRPLKLTGGLEHCEQIIQVCPNPDPNYFWGIAEIERLTPLQVYRNRCLAQIDHMQELQAHPPTTASGFPSDLLEMQYVLDTPGGFMNQPDPASVGGQPRADRIKIEIPEDLYARIDRIDAMFEDMSGLPAITQGKSVAGVRSGGHASELAKLGSSRAKKRALVVEDSLEQVATLYLRILAKYDGKTLSSRLGEKFVAEQFTDDFVVKVDGHSNSPIFADDANAMAAQLLKMKVITRERFIDMISVPNKRQLKYDLKKIIEPAEKAAAEAAQKLEQERIDKGAKGRPAKPGGQHPS